jgi:hypothetical protein
MHQLSFEPPYEFFDTVRALIGVTAVELPDATIMTLAIVGQAEQEMYILVPTIKTLFEDFNTEELTLNRLMIAFTNLIAFYAYPPLKVSLLSSESDNKTIATRFKDALSRDPNDFKNAAKKILVDTGLMVPFGSPDLLTFVTPYSDVVTGRTNAR